jgi:hypothetical protein
MAVSLRRGICLYAYDNEIGVMQGKTNWSKYNIMMTLIIIIIIIIISVDNYRTICYATF